MKMVQKNIKMQAPSKKKKGKLVQLLSLKNSLTDHLNSLTHLKNIKSTEVPQV